MKIFITLRYVLQRPVNILVAQSVKLTLFKRSCKYALLHDFFIFILIAERTEQGARWKREKGTRGRHAGTWG